MRSAFALFVAAGLAVPAHAQEIPVCPFEAAELQVYKNPPDAKKFGMALAGKLVPVAGDPDGAVFQEGQGDNTAPTV